MLEIWGGLVVGFGLAGDKGFCSYLSMVAHETLRNGVDLQLVSYILSSSAQAIHTGWKTASSAIPAEPKGDISAVPSST